jgi:hypothetical protein
MIEAKTKVAEPVWPEDPAAIEKALEVAFKNILIESCDHPVLKKLRGEI